MNNRSILSCEHLRAHRLPGRTDAMFEALRAYLTALFQRAAEFGSAEITITLDGVQHRYEWLGGTLPEPAGDVIAAIGAADLVDVRIDICSDHAGPEALRRDLEEIMSSGELRDCAFYVALIQDDQTSSLVMCGIYHGAYLHGAVPFSGNNEDILVHTVWSGITHKAAFRLRADAAGEAAEVVDGLEQRFEIDLSFSPDGRDLTVSGIVLRGHDDVWFYRDSLKRLAALSERSQITGALSPEDDRVFALLRFVQEGSEILIQTAVAER